jgi:hypothetical protein
LAAAVGPKKMQQFVSKPSPSESDREVIRRRLKSAYGHGISQQDIEIVVNNHMRNRTDKVGMPNMILPASWMSTFIQVGSVKSRKILGRDVAAASGQVMA